MFRTTQVPPRLRTRFRVRVFHPLRKCFPALSPNLCGCLCRRSYNPGRCVATPPVWAPALSLATTRAITVVFFSSGYLDVSVPRVGPWQCQVAEVRSAGLPHSDIRASTGICPWARLFAACHVLLRLREPRHPSCALLSFPFIFQGKCLYDLLSSQSVDYLRPGIAPREIVFLSWLTFFDLLVISDSDLHGLSRLPSCQCSLFFV